MAKCVVVDCELPVRARDLCARHYARLRKYGDATIQERLTQEQGGLCAICHRPGTLEIEGDGEHTGLLCHHCKLGVKNFLHSPTLLKAAVDFIGPNTNAQERQMFAEWESQVPDRVGIITLFLDDWGEVKVVAPSLSYFLTRAMLERGLEIVNELYDMSQMIMRDEDEEG